MDTTMEGKQENQNQERQREGKISQGINVINGLARGGLRNPLAGSRITGQAAIRGFSVFLATNSWIWIILGITALVIIVFIIALGGISGGIPDFPAPEQPPITAPTEASTPTPPAAP